MILKNKRINTLTVLLLFAGMQLLFNRIGGLGMLYTAVCMEPFFLFTYLFFGGLPDAMEYSVRSGRRKEGRQIHRTFIVNGILYCVVSCLIIAAVLMGFRALYLQKSSLMYVDRLMPFLLLAVPFMACMQLIKGIFQTVNGKALSGAANLVFVVLFLVFTWLMTLLYGDYGRKAAELMQSVQLEYFYIILAIIPGLIIGAIGAILCSLLFHRVKGSRIERAKSGGESFLTAYTGLFIHGFSETAPVCFLHAVLLAVLLLSEKYYVEENYILGHFYGIVLPFIGILAGLYSLVLSELEKNIAVLYRKNERKAYYRYTKTAVSFTWLLGFLILMLIGALHKPFLAIWQLQTYDALMRLTAASGGIGFLYLVENVLYDLMRIRGLNGKILLSQLIGALAGLLASGLVCKLSDTAGSMICIPLYGYLGVSVISAAVLFAADTGAELISGFRKALGGIAAGCVIGLLLYGLQRMIFTALGGMATFVIGMLLGHILYVIAIFALHIFDAEEWNRLYKI